MNYLHSTLPNKAVYPIQRIAALVLCLLFGAISIVQPVFADETFYSSNDILYYDANAADACSTRGGTGTSTVLVGNDNIEKTLRFFVAKGMTLMQAAAIAGNFQQESGFNPTIENSIGAYGIAQWLGDRKVNLQAKANYDQLDTQLEFVWEELNGSEKRAYDTFLAYDGDSVSDLSVVFGEAYERYGRNEEGRRREYAEQIYTQFNGVIIDAVSSTASSLTTCTGNGTASAYTDDGFVIYDQSDSQWGNELYSTSTITNTGCGPAAMAMIITALTGQVVTPSATAAYGQANGTAAPEGGSNWNIQTVIGSNWGLTSTQLQSNVAEINQALRDGALIITSGSGANPFSATGHYIVIRGVTSEGKWKIGDSSPGDGIENSMQDWDPEYILGIANSDNIWAVRK